MLTVKEIEIAVSELSSEEFSKFREWFEEFDNKIWDLVYKNW
ncbi:MAG: hypothetical protein ACPL7B_05255 [Candidatus Poribacteria bacterium]